MRDLKARKPLLAIEALENLTREHPKFADAYLALGLANAQLGRRTRALDMYERFLVLAPAHPKAERVREMLAAYGR
jgi:tetratricopeptide (TPR) repeat protein